MNDRLRICFVCFMFSPAVGGAEIRAEKQARRLQELGHEVTIVTLRSYKHWKRREICNGLPVIRVGGSYKRNGQLRVGRLGHLPVDIAMFHTLWQLRSSYDIIHVFQLSPLAAIATLVGKLTHIPVVISSQSAEPDTQMQERIKKQGTLLIDTLIQEQSMLKVDTKNLITGDVTVLSRLYGGRAMLHLLRRSDAHYQSLSTRSLHELATLGFRKENITYISGSVQTDVFYPVAEKRPDPSLAERTIVCVARLEYSKGVDVLLHAWFYLLHSFQQSAHLRPRLLLVGTGQLQPQLEYMAHKLHIEDTVEFLGLRTDTLELLQTSWGFVLPSRWEGMPNALLEAMACGLPCVATRVSGSEDVINNGINGLLVAPEQPVDMAHALQRIITDTDFAWSIGQAARETMVQQYQLPTIVDQCVQLYRNLIAQSALLPGKDTGQPIHETERVQGEKQTVIERQRS